MNSIWIRDFFPSPQEVCVSQTGWDAPCSGTVGFLPVRSQRVRHRRGKSWLTAQSTSAYQKSETEIFKHSHKELNSPSAQYMPGSIFVWQARQGLVSPTGFPCFGNGFCVSHHSSMSVGNRWYCTTKPYQQSYSPHHYYHSLKKALILSSIKHFFTLYLF